MQGPAGNMHHLIPENVDLLLPVGEINDHDILVGEAELEGVGGGGNDILDVHQARQSRRAMLLESFMSSSSSSSSEQEEDEEEDFSSSNEVDAEEMRAYADIEPFEMPRTDWDVDTFDDLPGSHRRLRHSYHINLPNDGYPEGLYVYVCDIQKVLGVNIFTAFIT